ncbi:uncharacterized protein LOC132699284 isoform X2 [Cylas formicarius]|nr:uncharacterized protein LOC132699284 isoform X2 [Cylas formicarius]
MEQNSGYDDHPSSKKCSLAIFCGKTSLFVLMTGYALFGAVVFKFLESGTDHHPNVDFQKSRDDCLKELWTITERLNVLYEKNWTKLVTEQLKRFERTVVETAKSDGALTIPAQKWTFGGSLLYSVTLLTTVGYGSLSPKTAAGKIVAILYAIIGVPMMLILLSSLGGVLADGAKKWYAKLRRRATSDDRKGNNNPDVEYRKAVGSPTANHLCRQPDDTTAIQLPSVHGTPNHVNDYAEHYEVPKRAILATVRPAHSRGRCRQGQVRQILADPMCPTHSHNHGTPLKNSSIVGISTDVDLDEAEENDPPEQGPHDTPSRIPLIWRPPDSGCEPNSLPPPAPPVPSFVVFFLFCSYVCLGAVCFASSSGWTFLDATYFCFVALSTIGVGDRPPHNQNGGDFQDQLQMFASCVYIFVGLVIVAMCFSLLQEEVTVKCRQLAHVMGVGGRQ